jgi:hypothetical protein
MCEVKPVTREEAYRVLRVLALRMDKTAEGHREPNETLEESRAEFNWALAIDRILDACDCLR